MRDGFRDPRRHVSTGARLWHSSSKILPNRVGGRSVLRNHVLDR